MPNDRLKYDLQQGEQAMNDIEEHAYTLYNVSNLSAYLENKYPSLSITKRKQIIIYIEHNRPTAR